MLGIILQITQTAVNVQDSVAKAANQAVAAATQTQASNSLWDIIVDKGGTLMVILMALIFFLSVLAVYFFFERLIAIKKASKSDAHFFNSIKEYIYDSKLDAAKTLCKSTNSPVSRMVAKGLERIGKPINDIEKAMENVGRFEILKLEKNLKILGIVAGMAPMLGFIGTILGVIVIFFDISLSKNIAIDTIASGLYVKMISSAAGLIVGTLAYAGYHYLNILLDKVIFRLEDSSLEFMDLLQKEA
ncbi:MAG: MotA/TolQ/ExbB proton channel family protein [Bacteroidetes bacterium]|nr:MotA/TolQ/ExbB proton channel family protein [Bacteroidota bacterium]